MIKTHFMVLVIDTFLCLYLCIEVLSHTFISAFLLLDYVQAMGFPAVTVDVHQMISIILSLDVINKQIHFAVSFSVFRHLVENSC
jgi:hypothetical protein